MSDLTPGLCLTFDDLYVENWCSMRWLFDKMNVRVTFCVCHLHQATPEQIFGLHQLQDDGHEIAFHSRTHPKLIPYLEKHGLDHWVEHEIDAGIAEHREHGFPATSFAYPFHAHTEETLKATASRFKLIRAATHRTVTEATLPDRVYKTPGADNAVDNIGSLDVMHRSFRGWAWQAKVLDTVAEHQGVGVLVGHNIIPKSVKAGQAESGFHSNPRHVRRLLNMASNRGLRFYTMSEFADAVHASKAA